MIQGTFRRLMMRSGGSQLSDAAAFLASYGPFGMVMDFTDASISINDVTDVLDYNSQGTISSTTGLPLGPGSKLTYTAPSLKFTEQADGYIAGRAHNLYLNSEAPADQSITVINGATYAVTITGSGSITASGATAGTWTAGTNTFTATTTTLSLGSTSVSGTVHVRRTPSVSTYVATTGAIVYDIPYVYSSGVKTGILVEPAATNNASYGSDWSNAVWFKSSTASAVKNATGPDNVANSASTLTFSGAGGIGRTLTKGSPSVEAMSVYARRSGALSGSIYMNVSGATSGTSLVTGTDSDFSGAGNWVNRSDAGGNAVVTGGRLEISQGINNTQRGRAELQLTGLTIGRVYRVLTDATGNVVGTSSQAISAYTGANLTGTQLCNLSVTTGINQTYHFVATETTIYLVFSTAGTGSTFTFAVDDVEVYAMAETDVTSQITTDWTRLGEVQAGSIQHPAFSLRATTADTIEVALFQSETGSVVTSPIITYGAAVTRAADNSLKVAVANFPVGTAHTLYMELQRPEKDVTATFVTLQGTSTDFIQLIDDSASLRGVVRTVADGVTATLALATENALNTPFKIAISADTTADGVHDGGSVVSDAACICATTFATLDIGHASLTRPMLVKAIAYLPARKSGAELQGMTTP